MVIPSYLIILLNISFYTLLLTGVVIFIRMLQKKMINLLGLVLFFVLYALQTNPPSFLPEYITINFVFIALFSLAFFIKYTFYRGRKSAFPYVIATLIILRVSQLILKAVFQFQPGFIYPSNSGDIPFFFTYIIVTALQELIIMIWYSISVFRSFNNFRKLGIKKWIKVRYLMVGISTIIFSIDTSLSILLVINDIGVILFLIYASIINILLFTTVNVVAWVIPFKTLIYFLKKETPQSLEDVSESEIMAKVKSELPVDKSSGNP